MVCTEPSRGSWRPEMSDVAVASTVCARAGAAASSSTKSTRLLLHIDDSIDVRGWFERARRIHGLRMADRAIGQPERRPMHAIHRRDAVAGSAGGFLGRAVPVDRGREMAAITIAREHGRR